MVDRDRLILAFLTSVGWGDAARAPLAGDASNRRYLRVRRADGARAVLMDAPTQKGEDTGPFLHIAEHLSRIGLSAPQILGKDPVQGFLLLEDLGDALFARVLEERPELEETLYEAAVDALLHLRAAPLPEGVDAYGPEAMGPLSALAVTWYRGGITGAPSAELERELCAAVTALTGRLADGASCLILRDYHAENLIWLPERVGVARVGQLDFQDAMAGHEAYDLVSLLQDARRDVSAPVVTAMKARFCAATDADPDRFAAAYAALGAQRALRILGVFARLCLRDGKAHYVDLIPRVWAALQDNLAHPELYHLADCVARALPPPTSAILLDLKARCRTLPTPP